MKKESGKKISIQINLTNRGVYTLLLLMIVAFAGVGVYAFGTQNPASFGHSSKELDLSGGVDGNAVFNGNVGIGVSNPTAKLDVAGELKVGNTGVACDTSRKSFLRFDSTSGKMQLCDGSSWAEVASGTAVGGLPFYGTSHTKDQCRSAGGTVTDYQSNSFCKFQAGTCPAGWTKHQNLGSTSIATCGSPSPGTVNCPASPCTTAIHYFGNIATETCSYRNGDADYDVESGYTCTFTTAFICTANLIEVGCY